MDEIIYWKSIPVSLENSKSFSGKLFRYPIPSGCSYVKAMMELFSGHRGCGYILAFIRSLTGFSYLHGCLHAQDLMHSGHVIGYENILHYFVYSFQFERILLL